MLTRNRDYLHFLWGTKYFHRIPPPLSQFFLTPSLLNSCISEILFVIIYCNRNLNLVFQHPIWTLLTCELELIFLHGDHNEASFLKGKRERNFAQFGPVCQLAWVASGNCFSVHNIEGDGIPTFGLHSPSQQGSKRQRKGAEIFTHKTLVKVTAYTKGVAEWYSLKLRGIFTCFDLKYYVGVTIWSAVLLLHVAPSAILPLMV